MVDTTTPILGLLLQGTGGNNNSWGTNLNNSVITPLENAVKGLNAISGLTGGAYALTQANAAYATISLAGTLASDLTITVPATANKWTFINNLTMAGFYVLIKVAGQTAVNIPGGAVLDITCDGTNMYRADRAQIGELFYHAGSVPNGALECNGATPLRLSAVDLFAAISTTWGTGNGATTFTIPDGYTAGKFIRSRTASVTLGTAQANQNKSHTHAGATFSGTTSTESADHSHAFSGTTNGQNQTHTHSESIPGGPVGLQGGGTYPSSNIGASTGTTGPASVDHTHTFSGVTAGKNATHTHTFSGTTGAIPADGGTEARPENLSAILCIRY